MALTSQSGAGLVKGSAPVVQKPVKLQVARAFCIAGVRKEVGETVEVSQALAVELLGLGKAIAYVEKPAAPVRRPAPKEKAE